ncbi:hypothetical protein SAMN06269185_2112 [Natronoarchaeum philippinense]|uniref:Halobacterial output domain-containing protein n=1 Tax=Natronoarchaeum philippinense TaxID=558529 RepID=A0A285NW89_NATPI|nr:HalOD1 output domain-containing protein [Natronoarchaeum philippinense]SNZ13307.1 hypothetical protein SAMN06269185_2112 [Natronoarchaeum philippinense]
MNDPAPTTSDDSALLWRPIGADEPCSTAVVDAVAAASNTDQTDLRPLYETIDPDMLDSLFGSDGSDGTVRFEYENYGVVVQANERIELYERSDWTPSP